MASVTGQDGRAASALAAGWGSRPKGGLGYVDGVGGRRWLESGGHGLRAPCRGGRERVFVDSRVCAYTRVCGFTGVCGYTRVCAYTHVLLNQRTFHAPTRARAHTYTHRHTHTHTLVERANSRACARTQEIGRLDGKNEVGMSTAYVYRVVQSPHPPKQC